MMELENRPHPEKTLPVMVEPVPQTGAGPMYRDELDALYHGTVFKELYKPMRGYDKLPEPRGRDEDKAEAFAFWDELLWLDTHCHMQEADAVLQDLRQKAHMQGRQSYAQKALENLEKRMASRTAVYDRGL